MGWLRYDPRAHGLESCPLLCPILDQIAEIGDYNVNSEHFIIRKRHPAVDNHNVIFVFQYGHILSDFVQTANWNHL